MHGFKTKSPRNLFGFRGRIELRENSVGPLLFQHGDFGPAGGGFGELARREAPDDELLALDPLGVLCVLAVEVRMDGSGGAVFHADAVDR